MAIRKICYIIRVSIVMLMVDTCAILCTKQFSLLSQIYFGLCAFCHGSLILWLLRLSAAIDIE